MSDITVYNFENDPTSIIGSSASDVAQSLAASATSIVKNLDVPSIETSQTASYESITPEVSYYTVLPPTEPIYPAFDSYTKPVFEDIDLYLRYTSDFLNQVRAYLDVNTDGLNEQFKANTYSLEDNRLSNIKETSVTRVLVNNSVFDYPVQDIQGATDKINQEFDFETAYVIRYRNIETAKRLIEQAKYVTSQGAEIEKTLMMYGPELALEKAKMQGAQADAYATAVNAINTEVNAIVQSFNAQITAYSAEGKSLQAYNEINLHRDMSLIAINKSVATIQAISDKVYIENQANKVSLQINSEASIASVASHGAAGALAADYTSLSYNTRGSEQYNYNTSFTTKTETSDVYQEIYEKRG